MNMTGQRRWHFECPDCQYDDQEHGQLLTDGHEHCPLCWLDNGHIVAVRKWLATEDANRDDRPALSP